MCCMHFYRYNLYRTLSNKSNLFNISFNNKSIKKLNGNSFCIFSYYNIYLFIFSLLKWHEKKEREREMCKRVAK